MSGKGYEQMWGLEQAEVNRHYDGLEPGDVRRMREAMGQAIDVLSTIAHHTTDQAHRSSIVLCADILADALPSSEDGEEATDG